MIRNIKRNTTILKLFDTELQSALAGFRKYRAFDEKKYIQQKVTLINNYCKAYAIKTCIVGVSGGIDSAVVLGLLKCAKDSRGSFIRHIMPVQMPIFSKHGATNQHDAKVRGQEVIRHFGFQTVNVDLTRIHASMKRVIDGSFGIKGGPWADGQLVSYIRTPALYYLTSLCAQQGMPAIVCGTTNMDEGAYLGYFGKASDGMVDVQLISDIHKSEVYTLARYFDIPKHICEVPPSGDLYDGRADEEVFGVSYDAVELFLHIKISDPSVSDHSAHIQTKTAKKQLQVIQKRLEHMHEVNMHKYIGCTPAIHLNTLPVSVPGGWNYSVFSL